MRNGTTANSIAANHVHSGGRNCLLPLRVSTATIIAIGLLSAERDAAVLFDIARSRLDQVRLPAATRALRLVADELPIFVPAGRDLFDTRPQQAVPWEQLRERLRARLGADAVHGLGLQADHRPERATGTATPRASASSTLMTDPSHLLGT